MLSSSGYGTVSGVQSPDGRKKKKILITGISAVVLVAMVVAVTVGIHTHNSESSSSGSNGGSSGELSASMKAIQSICQPTDYKKTCEDTLSAAAGSNTTDPKELVKITFQVAMQHIREVFNHSEVLAQAEKDPRTGHALQNCKELMDYAIDDLQHSFQQLGELDITKIHKIIEDLKIWLSAAVTYEETCLDGFENTTGNAGASMRKAMKSASELTSNTLAIVDEISSVLTSFQIPNFNRRLLSEESTSDGFPAWVSTGRRRLLQANPAALKPDVVVAQDGSGTHKTINEALNAVPLKSNKTFVVYVKQGIYKEQVVVTRSMTNVMMIGDGPTKTKITGNLNFIDGTPTFKTATFAVIGNGFIGKNFGVENSAGAAKHQAVALRVQSDMSVFYNCQFDGYQDTLYVHTHRQFYRECTISGTIDFVFGDSAVVFQNCVFLVRKPLDNQQCIVTAQGRKDKRESTAIILHNCTIAADPSYYPFRNQLKAYLGRPWKPYSRTFILQSQIDDLISPAGWLPWLGDVGLNTCFYTEFDNRGAGAAKTQRVKWRGVKKIDWNHAQMFTVEHFIQGQQWIQASGVPFTPGLLPVTTDGPKVNMDAGPGSVPTAA